MVQDPERDTLADDIGDVRRALLSGFVLEVMAGIGGAELSMTQVATLYTLDRLRAPTQRELAASIKRSVSATSRLVDQLVRRGMVARRDDPVDRRVKRIALTDDGSAFLRTVERLRADAQRRLVADLDPEERLLVFRAMALLAESARRHSHARSESPGPDDQ